MPEGSQRRRACMIYYFIATFRRDIIPDFFKIKNYFRVHVPPRVVGNYTAAKRSGSGEKKKRITGKRKDLKTDFQYFSPRLFITIFPVNRRGVRATFVRRAGRCFVNWPPPRHRRGRAERVDLFRLKNGGVCTTDRRCVGGRIRFPGGNDNRFENTRPLLSNTSENGDSSVRDPKRNRISRR